MKVQAKPQRKESSTLVSTEFLRRSPRLKVAHDGHMHRFVPTTARKTNKNKSKARGKKVAPQSDLLDNLSPPPNCFAFDFPGLSAVLKCNEEGTLFPEISVPDIQRIATERCCIHPSEVTTELLLATRTDDVAPDGSSTRGTQLVING